MYMRDWIAKLDDFLRISDREILTHAGRVTHEAAKLHSDEEFEKWRQHTLEEPSQVEKDFDSALENLKAIKKLPAKKIKPAPIKKD